MRAFIGLGSNLGDREDRIRAALDGLASLPQTTLGRVSSLYETAPVGELEQPDFLNAVAIVETELTARQLLWNLLRVERQLGRVRNPGARYGPRIIDLDLLLYGDLVVDEPDLRLPHPELSRRGFVLVPLVELDPLLVHPATGEAMVGLLQRLQPRPPMRRMRRLQD